MGGYGVWWGSCGIQRDRTGTRHWLWERGAETSSVHTKGPCVSARSLGCNNSKGQNNDGDRMWCFLKQTSLEYIVVDFMDYLWSELRVPWDVHMREGPPRCHLLGGRKWWVRLWERNYLLVQEKVVIDETFLWPFLSLTTTPSVITHLISWLFF